MKFGLYLKEHMVQEWKSQYLQYDELKRMISILAAKERLAPQPTYPHAEGGRLGFSLTVPPPTNAAAMPLGSEPPPEGGDSDGPCTCWCGVGLRAVVLIGWALDSSVDERFCTHKHTRCSRPDPRQTRTCGRTTP